MHLFSLCFSPFKDPIFRATHVNMSNPMLPLCVINYTATHGVVVNKQTVGHSLVKIATLTKKVFNLLNEGHLY